MGYIHRGRTWEDYASQFVFTLVMLAPIFPMLPLQDQPDPLFRWFNPMGIHSMGVAFVLALASAAATYYWLRAHPNSPPRIWFTCGATIGLVPGLFYFLSSPLAGTAGPVISILVVGIVSGTALGGPAYLLLRYLRSRRHVA